MGLTNFPVDIVVLAMIAAFLVLRLRSVLGKREGFERDGGAPARPTVTKPAGRVIDVQAEPARAQTAQRPVPDRDSPAGQTVSRIQAMDPQFAPARFLDGAETAFRLIVLGFGHGDHTALRPLLTPAMMDVFDGAIAERTEAGHIQHTTLHSIRSATLEHAELIGSVATVSVRFVSDQVNYANDAQGQTAIGTEAVTEITDVWSFERDLNSRDPAWRLAATQSA